MVTSLFCLLVILLIGWFVFGLFINISQEKWWDEFNKNPYNFPFKYKGKKLWYSRSCAVSSFVFNQDREGEWYVLANKRGDGVPDFKGLWNAPCGYCDFGEKCVESARREVLEETGINLDVSYYEFYGINDDPEDSNKQNITIRFYAKIKDNPIDVLVPHETDLGEKDEVADVRWIKVRDVDNYKWAFNHNNIIKEIYNKKII